VNLGIVATFALIAVLLMTLTWTNSLAARSSLATALTPQLNGVNQNLGGLPALDRTAELTGRLVVAAVPIGAAVAHSRESIEAGAVSSDAIRDGVHSIAASVAETGDSVTSITASLRSLAPLTVTITELTGDITRSFSKFRKSGDVEANALAKALNTVQRITADTSAARDRMLGIRQRLKRIAKHSENAAAAKILELGKRRAP
jgi:hypothetical protein